MLENLFVQTLSVSVQATLLLLPLFFADRWLTRAFSSQARCFLWLVFSVRLLIPMTFAFPLSAGNAAMQGSAGTISSAGSQAVCQQPDVLSQAFPASPVPTFDSPMELFYEHLPLLEGLALVWVMGSICFLLAHIGFYLFHIRFLKKSAESGLGPEQSILLEQVRKDMHIRRDIPVRISSHAEGPMILGLFRPVLILPQMKLTQQQLTFIFRHELAHYRRHDLLMKWLFLFAQSVHWFNPLVHILAKKANLDLENACDDTVLKGKSRLYRKEYGTVLLEVLTEQSHRVPLSTGFSGKKKEMVRRFQNIVHPSPKRNGHVLIGCIAVALVLLTSSLNPASAQALNPSVLSQLKATHTTLEEQAATKALLVQCLEGSMFETYRPFRDLPLTDENYQRYEQAEESYCDLLRKYPENSQVYEYTSNPYFLLVDIQSLMSNGIFCCQTDQDRAEGCFRMIWMDFSDPTSLQVTDLGIAYPNKGRYLNENIQFIQQQSQQAYNIATRFGIDLSKYQKAYTGMYPAVIENHAINLGWSIQEQLKRLGPYKFEQFDRAHMMAYIHNDSTQGVILNADRSGIYAHYFEIPTIDERNQRKTLESQFPIIRSECQSS